MKPAIAYGIAGSIYSNDWKIISITSEKGGPRGQVYGRDEHDVPTHHKPEDVTGRFPTIELATAGLQALRQIHADHQPAIDVAAAEHGRLQHARNEVIRKALADMKVTPAAAS